MTVPSEVNSVSYAGNGSTTVFAIPYYFLENSHIKAILRSSTGIETVWVINVDYTLAGAGVQAGGTLTATVAPATGTTLVISRSVPATQETDYPANDPFPSSSHERALDKLTMLQQQSSAGIKGAIRVPDTDPEPARLPSVAQRFEKLLSFDVLGNPVAILPSNQSATDLELRLANTIDPLKGASLIGFDGITLSQLIKSGLFHAVDSITALRALDKTKYVRSITSGYYALNDGGHGAYYLDTADTSSADDGGSVIVASDGGRWKFIGVTPSSKQYGAKGDNLTLDTVAFAKQTTKATAVGGLLNINKGLFKVAGVSSTIGAINVDASTITAEPVTDTKRIDILGAGQAQSLLMNTVDATYALSLNGAPGVSSHFHSKVQGVGFGGGSLRHGLRAFDVAYAQFKDLGFWGLDTCLRLESVLSSDFENITCSDSVTGISANKGAGFSGINAISIRKAVFRTCSSFGIAVAGPCVNFSVVGGSTEACGTHANSSTGGMSFTVDGAEGGVGVIVENHYFENNGGAADISLFNSGSAMVTHYFKGCNFNRVSASNFVTNNVLVTGGPQRLIFEGCSFNGFNSYVESASRLYVNAVAGVQIICIGCTFGNTLAQGTLRNVNASIPFTGNITAAGVANLLPAGWSISHPSAGVYTITHNLNVPITQQSLVATSVASTALIVQRTVLTSANVFTIATSNLAGTLTDSDFTFHFSIA